MNEQRVMDEDYARLSLQAGYLNARIDSILGGNRFSLLGREWAWRLTPELLEQWKQQAIQLGATVEQLSFTPVEQEAMEQTLTFCLQLQQQADAQHAAQYVERRLEVDPAGDPAKFITLAQWQSADVTKRLAWLSQGYTLHPDDAAKLHSIWG